MRPPRFSPHHRHGIRRLLRAALLALLWPLFGCVPAIWSPDGSKIAVRAYEGLYVFDLRRERFTRLVQGVRDRREALHPAWSPESRRLCYGLAIRRGDSRTISLWTADTVTAETRRLVPQVPFSDYEGEFQGGRLRQAIRSSLWPSWSPDGNWIAYQGREGVHFSIWITGTSGRATPRRLVPKVRSVGMPAWSPDGRWIAFTAGERRRPHTPTGYEIIRADGTGRRLVWRHGAASPLLPPRWSADGRRLAVTVALPEVKEETSGDSRQPTEAWVVTVETGQAIRLMTFPDFTLPEFSPDLRTMWFLGSKPGLGADAPVGLLAVASGGRPRYLFSLVGKDDGFAAPSPDGQSVARLVDPGERRPARLRIQTGRRVRDYMVPK